MSLRTTPFEVTIVGGGLGGLTAALGLRQRGIRTTVVEQTANLGEIGAGIQTAPNASRILLGLGLRRQMEAIRTEPLDQVRRRWQDGRIIALTPLGEFCTREYDAPYWHYHRADLHQIILAACVDPGAPGPPTRICTGVQIVDLQEGDTERPVLVAADGSSFATDVVIGADGIHSRIRELVGAPDTLEFSGEMAYRALIPGQLLADDSATRWLLDRYQSTIWYGPDRHLVHYLIRDGSLLNVVAIVPCTEQVRDAYTAPATRAELMSAFPGWDDRVAAMLGKAGPGSTSWALYYRRRDPRWVYGHVALLGDACHAMLPYQAQGASQAMEDSAVLAEELGAVSRCGLHEALLRYASRRAKHAGMVQDASLQNMALYHLPDGPEQQLRDEKLKRFAGESDLSYEWLWQGSRLHDDDRERFSYPFAR